MDDGWTLADLVYHWGSAYRISYRRGRYQAIRHDDGSVLRADTAGELLTAIRDDYAARPVPRPPESRCAPAATRLVRSRAAG